MIQSTLHDGILLIKLNRPEKRNALIPELVNALKDEFNSSAQNKEVKIVIMSGEGTSFCAGADLSYLNDLRNYTAVENEEDSENLAELFLNIYKFPKPVIAAVNGPAIAGGCGLATVCDYIIADKQNAKFGYSEVKIGFLPAIVSIFLLKKIGEGKAKNLLLSGDILNAGEAYKIGLVDFISDDVLKSANQLAEKLLRNSSESLIQAKRMIENISNLSVDDAVKYCIRLNTISRSSEEFKKGLEKFLNK